MSRESAMRDAYKKGEQDAKKHLPCNPSRHGRVRSGSAWEGWYLSGYGGKISVEALVNNWRM